MRSFAEIRFRLRQELVNLWLLVGPSPHCPGNTTGLPLLPDPDPVFAQLRGGAFAKEVERLADLVLAHRLPLLGIELDMGPEIAWRRDPLSGIETPPVYFRRIPYLDPRRAGDHKVIWELNRHQFLVLLAQAWRFTGRQEFLEEITRLLESWFAQNPLQRGINWTSALEVAFRALSWIWVLHFTGEALGRELKDRLRVGLYQHGQHLEANLSVYFSPNTHLLGEAVALHALGVLFPEFRGAEQWRKKGSRLVREALDRQVFPDGAHFEQSTYYHVYALDFFLLHYLLSGRPREMEQTLRRMADFLNVILGPARLNPLLGDDDGGRLFHPYGKHVAHGRATLAACGAALPGGSWQWETEDLAPIAPWWLGAQALDTAAPSVAPVGSRWFADTGLVVLRSGQMQAIFDAGPFGAGSAGHSHADTLSLLVSHGPDEILIDPGTYTYVGDENWRNWFRSTTAHNTVAADGLSQADPAGPFRWVTKPQVRMVECGLGAEQDRVRAECRYRGIVHQRCVARFGELLAVVDWVDGAAGQMQQHWHVGLPVTRLSGDCYQIGGRARITFLDPATAGPSWRSTALGVKQTTEELVVRMGRRAAAVIEITSDPRPAQLRFEGDGLSYQVEGREAKPLGMYPQLLHPPSQL